MALKHQLGRIPSPPDERDYKLENFLHLGATATDPVSLAQQAASEAKLTTITYKKWAATTYPDVTTTHWWKMFHALDQIVNPTPPPPPPPSGDAVWKDPDAVLDQGNYGTCVGNGCAQWCNTDPVNDHYNETDARAIYYEATVLDGSPDDPDAPGGGQQGATVRSGMKALKNRGRLSTYAVTTDLATVRSWLQTKGPVVFGTDWLTQMFYPAADGLVNVSGSIEGGHCYLAVGDLQSKSRIRFLNSWGSEWSVGGYFEMTYTGAQKLLDMSGEAWTAVELAV